MKNWKLLFLFVLLLSNIGCIKESNFPNTPVLTFKEYKLFGSDSLKITFEFTDGDGNLGLEPSDTSAPYNPAAFAYNNLFLYYQSMNEDSSFSYRLVSKPNNEIDTSKVRYRFKNITPVGQRKVLEGEISTTLIAPFKFDDNYRYEIFMLDRSLNKSNLVSTPLIK